MIVSTKSRLQKIQIAYKNLGFDCHSKVPFVDDFSGYEIVCTVLGSTHKRYQDCLDALEVFLIKSKNSFTANYLISDERDLLFYKIEYSLTLLKLFNNKGYKSFESFKNLVHRFYPETKESLLDAFWNGEYFLEIIIDKCNDVYNRIN